ncbi:AIPR family protein [Janthinobacterium sp.]|uniref:AIPR family protein n=1 Tax=Janthinobacterium sp. TaxID=1871054 RepID=UPI0028983368|nr:AIPR family protein [Janthinobacterium sp.]
MQPEDFLDELTQMVARRSAARHLVDTLAFVHEVADRLADDPVFGEFRSVEYQSPGTKNRTLKLHGFTPIDESDGTVGIVIGKWEDITAPQTLGTAVVDQLSSWVENFVREAVENNLHEKIAHANDAYDLALQLNSEVHRINRIRIHIFSNLSLSSRFKEDSRDDIAGIPIERHIWDLNRLTALYESGREREAVRIELEESGGTAIPCLEAARSGDICSYLCVVKGDQLADMFERYGSRLLEGNVRAFLGMKGGVNKGIRATIQDEPGLFFAYNNGIAATASDVTVESRNGQLMITGLTDLQIVNGGQTTASILSARKKDHLSLTGVSVPMKLTRVFPDRAQELIPSIAEFANTQNKVAAADFFSNHPFHRKMEEISRRLLTPARASQRIQSKWFYERARGQYQNGKIYLDKSKKAVFEREYPAEQLISKTDLAKYAHTWDTRPHWVSLGAQKNFTKFAGAFSSGSAEISESENWERLSPLYGESFFRNMVAVCLVWKKMEETVDAGRKSWYEGGYRVNIVTYTLAKLFQDIRNTREELDLERIWNSQDAGEEVAARLEEIAPLVQQTLLSPPNGIRNIGEWCKRTECWDAIAALEIPYVSTARGMTISKDIYQGKKADNRKQGQVDDAIDLQSKLLHLTESGYWASLYSWPKGGAHLSPTDRALVLKASTLQGFLKIGLQKDWKRLASISETAEGEGFRQAAG